MNADEIIDLARRVVNTAGERRVMQMITELHATEKVELYEQQRSRFEAHMAAARHHHIDPLIREQRGLQLRAQHVEENERIHRRHIEELCRVWAALGWDLDGQRLWPDWLDAAGRRALLEQAVRR